MSLVQYHGEQSPSLSKYLTEDGLVKDGPTSIYDPVLHLPLGMYNENDKMYDKWALRRFREFGTKLLPRNQEYIPPISVAPDGKYFKGLVFNYLGNSYLVEGEEKLKVITDPVDNTIMHQMFRVGHYCNLQNLLFQVRGTVFYNKEDKDAEIHFCVDHVSPWVNDIFLAFGAQINIFERLEEIVSNVEGIGRPFVLGSGQDN